jgi:putative ABC transport system permease protein
MAQVVLANILVVGGCLMARSFVRLVNVDTGFETEEVIAFYLALPTPYQEPEQVAGFHERLRAGLTGIPGLRSMALASDLPFQRENRYQWVSLRDDAQLSGDRSLVEYRRVGPDYFRTMDIRLVSGREFQPEDGREGDEVPVIVNERMVARYWPNQDVLGVSFQAEALGSPARVVGVVVDVLDDGLDGEVEARFYEPFFHRPTRGAYVVLRAGIEPAPLVAAVRREIESMESEVLLTRFRTMDDLVGRSLADDRIALKLAVVFSTLALALAAVGLFGLMSYTVSQRQHEIGVRGALGARQADVMRLVLGQSGRLTLAGTIVGIGVALPLARLLSAYLFGIRPADPVSFALVPLILLSVGFLSSYLPARRAARISPAETLREIR